MFPILIFAKTTILDLDLYSLWTSESGIYPKYYIFMIKVAYILVCNYYEKYIQILLWLILQSYY